MAFPKIGVEAVVEGYGDFQSKLGKMGKSIAGVGKAAAKIAIGGMAVLGTAAIAVGAGFIKLASDAAALEGIRDAFAGIAESAGTSQEAMLAALQKGSLGMVTQRDLMATFNEAAQLVGVTFAQQLPDAMGYLSKVSAATGQDMGFMIDSLVKGVGRMSPMILDNLGIQVTLADATANAAEQFGVEADELSKTQLQAGMMNVVLEKLAENTAAMPDVAGTAAQAQAAFGVALKDTKDMIGLALLPAFTTLMTAVTAFATENLPKLVTAFEQHIVPAIETVIDWLGKKLPGVIQNLSTFLIKAWEQHIKPVLTAFMKFLSQTIPPIVNDVRRLITTVFGDIVDWVGTNLPKIQGTILTVMNAIRTAVEIALNAIADFWDAHGKRILAAVQNAWDNIRTTVETMFAVVKGIIEAAMQAINGDWEDAWDTIKETIKTVWEGIKTVIGNQLDTLTNTIIPVALDAIKTAIENSWNFLKDTLVPSVWEGITTGISTAWDTIRDEIVPRALDDIEAAIATAWDNLKAWVKRTWDDIKQKVKDAWDALKSETIPDALDAIMTTIDNAWTSLKEWVGTTWENIKETVKDVWRVLKDEAIPAGLEGIKLAITTAWNWLKDTYAPAVWEGFKRGIKTIWDALVNVIIPGALRGIRTSIEGAWNYLKDEYVPMVWRNIKEKVGEVWDALVKEAIPAGLEGIKLAIVAAWSWLGGTYIPAVWDGIKGAVKFVWDVLVDTVIPTALTAIQTAIKTAWDWLKDTYIPAVWAGIKGAVKAVWDALVGTVIPDALFAIELAIDTAWSILRDIVIPGIWGGIKTAIETAWTDIERVVQTGIDNVVDIVEGVADAMYNAGKAIVENIKQGIEDQWDNFMNWFKEKLKGILDWLPWASEPEDASSPLYGLGRAGAAIVTNLIEGMASEIPAMMDMGTELGEALIGAMMESLEEGERLIDELFKVGGALGGIGGVFLSRFQKVTLDPLKQRIKELEELLESGDLDFYGRIGAQAELNLLTEEYVAAQERVLALEQARADLQFLQAQLDLLDLITEYELDPEAILGGLELGLGANLEDIIDAMVEAMQQIIAQAEEELQIGSRSRVFQGMGEEMMAGMAMGIEQMAKLPQRASLIATQRTISIPALTMGAAPAAGPVNTEYNEYNLGGNTIASGMDQAQFEARVLRIVRRDAR